MSFKFYKNRITGHPSISLSSKNKSFWFNMPVSHVRNGRCFEVENPNKNDLKKTYIRKYVRHDSFNAKLHRYDKYKLSEKNEFEIKKYLKNRYKKDDVKPNKWLSN